MRMNDKIKLLYFVFFFKKESSEEEQGFARVLEGFFYLAYANVMLYLVGFFFKKKKNLILLLLRKRNVSHINYQTFFAIMSHT